MDLAWGWSIYTLTIAALVLAGGVGIVLTALQLPGTWFMLLAAILIAWLYDGIGWSGTLITWWTLILLLLLAVAGEAVETFASAAGARRAGASKRGMILSVVCGVIGAIVGTLAIPIPILGTLIGAALGAGTGSLLGDLWAGRKWGPAWTASRGAAVGRFWGALGKVAIACMMLLVIVAAVIWP